MAENCFYMMHIKGDKNAIDEFVGMMKNGEMGRFFSVEAEMDSDHEAIVSGDCAWSLSSAVLLSGTNRLVEPTFLNKMRKLGLSIEAYTEEPVAGFEEHFVFDKGVIAIKETTDLATYAARNLSEKDLQNIAKEHNATTDAVIASIDDEVVQIGGYDWIFDGKPAIAAVTAVLRERFLNFVEKEILESETGMYFIENDAWLQDDGFSPAEVRAMADELAADERTELVMEVGKDPFITFYPDFAKYLQAERESLAEVSINKGNLMNDRNVADCRNNKLDSLIHAAEVKGIGNAFDSALGTGAVFAAKVSEAGTDAPASYGLLSSVRGMRLSDFLEQSTDCSSGVDTLLLTTNRGNAVSIVEECHGAIRADGTEKVTEIEFRQLKPFVAYKTAQLLQSDGLDSAELDSLAAKIFMDMDGLQMCTDLAEQMAWECSTERTELAEVLWNGDPEQGIAALEDVAVDDDDCIKQEWMGYKPGTPRFEVWKDFETNFSKDGVSLCELSGFDDYKVEYKDPGPTLSKSEFDKLFGSDVLDENVQKDVSDVSWDDPGSEDER